MYSITFCSFPSFPFFIAFIYLLLLWSIDFSTLTARRATSHGVLLYEYLRAVWTEICVRQHNSITAVGRRVGCPCVTIVVRTRTRTRNYYRRIMEPLTHVRPSKATSCVFTFFLNRHFGNKNKISDDSCSIKVSGLHIFIRGYRTTSHLVVFDVLSVCQSSNRFCHGYTLAWLMQISRILP